MRRVDAARFDHFDFLLDLRFYRIRQAEIKNYSKSGSLPCFPKNWIIKDFKNDPFNPELIQLSFNKEQSHVDLPKRDFKPFKAEADHERAMARKNERGKMLLDSCHVALMLVAHSVIVGD